MRIALTHNLRLSDSVDEAEFDSPETIDALAQSLSSTGHDVERIEVSGAASRLVVRLEAYAPDLIFNSAEGRRGKMRRGFYPALFEQLGIPYTGSDSYALCVTLDKALTKKIVSGYGVPSPRARFVTRETLRAGGLDDVVYPVLVKPNYEGSSKGITQASVVDEPTELSRLIEDMLVVYPEGLLVEQYVPGVDVAACFLEGLPPGERLMTPVECVIHQDYHLVHPIYDYDLKHGAREHVTRRVPPALPAPVIDRIRAMSERVAIALGLRDAAKIDLRVSPSGQVWFLSATALPSFDARGALFAASAQHGLSYTQTILTTLKSAAVRAGLGPALEATKPRTSRSKRLSLKVGLAFNMKRSDTTSDDSEAEYDSPRTIEAITQAIEGYGHQVIPLEATGDFPRALLASDVDLVFNLAEGIRGRNREAQVPSLCELMNIPYTGSDPATLSLCLDKGLGKRLLREQGIETPSFQVLVTGREKLRPFRYPVIVKPNAEGTSKGITRKSVVDDEAGVRAAARELIDRYDQPALVEEYISGREFTVGLLGDRRPRVLPAMEVIFLRTTARPVYDYECKQHWEQHVRYECPANLTKEQERTMERVSRATFMALGCRDVARVDLRLAPDGRIWVIEVNPLPGLTPDYSDLCLIANGTGIDYKTLIGEILAGGIKRWRERQDRGKAQPSAGNVAAAPTGVEPSPPEAATPDPPMAEPPPIAPTLGALLTEN
jgi:D-alanine--D-alanine ligase